MEMTLALMCLTVGAGCLLWMLLLHFEEIHTAEEQEESQPKRRALLFLTLAGLTLVGALAVLAVEVRQLFTPAVS
jgi:low temperature requirement protein LtrA